MDKKKIIISVSIVVGLLILIGGGSYAWFNYYQVSNNNNILVAGDIRLTLNQGSDTISLENVFPETKEEARARENNTLTFTLNGANTSSKAILYNVLLNRGNDINNKNRLLDNELRFDLVEIVDNNEIMLVDDAGFINLSDTPKFIYPVYRD